MPKIHDFTVSVIKGSNKVIGCSESSVDLCRAGSYFRTKNSNIIYQVTKINPIMPIYDFELKNQRLLRINEDTGRKFLVGDILDISFKEFELVAIFDILNKGKNYKIDDILRPKDGVASYETSSGLTFPAEIIVNEVDEDGGIKQIGLKSNGKYIVCPPNDCEFGGGKGEGVKFRCEFELLSNRQIIERTITLVDHKPDYTDIFIDYNLPTGLKEGKLSCKKIELIIDKDFAGETNNSVEYEILNDFTFNYKLPLLVKNGLNTELALNQCLITLDQKIKELEDKVEKLSRVS